MTSPAAGANPLLLEQVSFNNSVDTAVNGVVIEAGDLIDFVVDCRTAHTSDSFLWTVQVNLLATDGTSQSYDSAAGFRGPSDPPGLIAGQIQSAWKLAYCRHPDPEELSAAMSFLSEQINYLQHNKDRIPQGLTETQQAMVNFCQALITSNEFLYVK